MEYSSLQYYALFATVLLLIGQIRCVRELRPSDHGLAYEQQSENDGVSQQGVLTFFGSATPSYESVPKPEAKNISDTWLNERRPVHGDREAGEIRGRDHVRLMLLVASGVCGLAGVVLLVVSGVVYVFRTMRDQRVDGGEESTSAVSSTVALACAEKKKGEANDQI